MQRSISNVDVVDDIEVILAPNFDSDNPHEVLGCHTEAGSEELDRAYRDLSRKYHPENTQQQPWYDDDDSNDRSNAARNRLIFQKISQAYARATGRQEVPNSQEAAQRAYENMFGKYRELYYNEGGLIGIPYSSDLKESLEETGRVRDGLSLSLCRLGDSQLRVVFFRTWLIKKEMSFWLCLTEILLTWSVIAFCKWTNTATRDDKLLSRRCTLSHQRRLRCYLFFRCSGLLPGKRSCNMDCHE